MPPHTMVGPYRVIEKIGAGGMGEVFLAEDPRLGRSVALKRLTVEGVGTDEQLRRLIQEGAAAAALNHPNIAAIYDVLEADGVAHIVMEYVPGETLASRLIRGPLPLDRLLHIAIQLCDGLAAAHARRIVHRDLKPSNVIVRSDGQVKILDFGLAERRAGAPVDVTVASGALGNPLQVVAGTPTYMSPEQLLGKHTDHRSDIYSLGVTLFQLATGRAPFEGDSFMSVALAILTGPAPDATGELGPALGPIVARAIARNASDRYQSAMDMRRDLQPLVAMAAETPTIAGEAFVGLGPATRTERRVFGWVAALVLAGVLSVILWWAIGQQEKVEAGGLPVVAIMPLQMSSPDARDEYLAAGIANALTSHLGGVKGITVITPGQVGPRVSGREVARVAHALGANYMLAGDVQVAGDQLQINAQLLRADLSLVRGISEHGVRSELFDIQRRVAQQLGDALMVMLPSADREYLGRSPSSSLAAFADYSEGRALLERAPAPGALSRAVGAFERAIAADPGFALAFAGLSDACWGQYRETKDAAWATRAEAAALQALHLDGRQVAVRVSLALGYHRTGRRALAVRELTAAIARQPNNDEARRVLGDIYAAEGRASVAATEYKRAIDTRPLYWLHHASLGKLYYRLGRFGEAIDAFTRAVALQPDNASALQMLGAAYQGMGRTDEALESYTKAIAIAPRPNTYSNIGTIHYWRDRFEAAVDAYNRAIALSPKDPVLYGNRGDAEVRLGRSAEAAASYRRAVVLSLDLLAVDPDDTTSRALLALYEAKTGDLAGAARDLARARAASPDDADVLYTDAVMAVMQGRSSDAIALLRRAIETGYSAQAAKYDHDLEPLHQFREFWVAVGGRN